MAQAISHAGVHLQQIDEQLSTRHPGGLHLSYFPAHTKGTRSMEDAFRVCALLDDSVKDIFNMVSSIATDPCCEELTLGTFAFSSKITFQDHVDGGLTMLLRAPGYRIDETTHVEDLVMDMYFTPCIVAEGNDQLKSDLAIFAQTFGQGLLMPHLHRLKACAKVEGIIPHESLPHMLLFFTHSGTLLAPNFFT